ncbi:MAG TPA: GGDEF domain-containing protein [Gammaproteobacteria bacterium]|nr:GGDEF domain-containing protein [Gammaproteobacteria bacterium]
MEHTFTEQIQVSELEIQQRKDLLNFTKEDAARLKSHRKNIAKRIDHIVEDFYARQVKIPEIRHLIGDEKTLMQLKNKMHHYILELFDGCYDCDYVERRLHIGEVHNRIGVSPKLYLSALYLLQSSLNQEIDRYADANQADNSVPALKEALHKLISLDTQFVFDSYISNLISELASAKNELSNYASGLEYIVAQRTQELEALSRQDSLTKLYNQRAFYEQIHQEMANAERHKDHLCLAYLDLNKFKLINDRQGHMAGDDVLASVGTCLLNSLRTTDFPCRYGGDEFVVIMPRTNLAEAICVCQRFITAFEQASTGTTISIGIANSSPDKQMDADNLIKAADKQMYKAKQKAHKDGASHICTA